MPGCSRGCCPSVQAHYRSLRFLSVEATEATRRETRLAKDQEAYKRLKAEGLQPAHMRGAAYIEQTAESAAQIEGRPEPSDDISFEPWQVSPRTGEAL